MQSLRVDVDDMHRVATTVAALAGGLAARAEPTAGPSWLASAAAAATARSHAAATRATLAERIRATADKLGDAATAYAECDAALGADVRAAGP